MKKKLITLCVASVIGLWTMAMNEETENIGKKKEKEVEISFEYERKPGGGSNQYAVWIENGKNEVVKTLFVTAFTTKGRARGNQPARRGYTFRPACVPTWVKNAKVTEMTDEEVDAFTGATPQSGKQTFVWDFTDTEGKVVPKGEYRICVEATLKDEYKMLFTGTVSTKDKAGEIKMQTEETGYNESYAGMVKDVKVLLKK